MSLNEESIVTYYLKDCLRRPCLEVITYAVEKFVIAFLPSMAFVVQFTFLLPLLAAL